MAEAKTDNPSADSWLSSRIAKVAGVVVAATTLVTAVIHFRDSIPWLTPVQTIEIVQGAGQNGLAMEVGDKFQVSATVKDAHGNSLPKALLWSSANPAIATIGADAIVTAVSLGETTLSASIGLVKGIALVHVRRVNVALIEVFPPETTLVIDDHLKLDATPYDSDGNSLLGRPVRWASENSLIVSVDGASGDTAARATGKTKVTAESEGKTNAASVTVSPRPAAAKADAEKQASTERSSADHAAGAGAPSVSAPAAAAPVSAHRPVPVAVSRHPRQPASATTAPNPSAAPPPAPAATETITVAGGVKTGDCPADVRMLLGGQVVSLKSDSQELSLPLAGPHTYNIHGVVSCPGQTVAVVNGHGSLSGSNQKAYRCRWQRTGPKNFTVELSAE